MESEALKYFLWSVIFGAFFVHSLLTKDKTQIVLSGIIFGMNITYLIHALLY